MFHAKNLFLCKYLKYIVMLLTEFLENVDRIKKIYKIMMQKRYTAGYESAEICERRARNKGIIY